jgi:DNA primase catalytic subunit
MVLNSDIEADRILLKLFMFHDDVVASSKDKIKPGIHRFYIEDKEAEAKADITKVELEYEAMTKVKSLSMEEMVDFGRICGLRVKDLSKSVIEAELLRKAQKEPNLVLSLYKDPQRKHKVFLRKLIDKDIVKIENGMYKYGDEILGSNETAAIDFLKDSGNSKLITEFSKMIQ